MSATKPPDPGGLPGNIQSDIICQNELNLKRKKRGRPATEILEPPLVPKPNLSFLVVKRADGSSISNVSPFLIDKLLSSSCGTVKNAKKLRDGTLLIETFSTEQGEKLIKNLPRNIHLPLIAEPHKSLNRVRGVITSPDLNSVALEEIMEHLKYQGVTDIYRITRKKNGHVEQTNSYVVTLCLANLPERLKIGYYSVPIRPYIPLPMRCRKCFKFNHMEANCPDETYTCPECSEPKHDTDCSNPKKCVNCGAAHSTLDRDCPRWMLERKVTEIKILENLPYTEAKRKVISQQVEQATRSYARSAITKPKETKDLGIQCNLPPLPPASSPKPRASEKKATQTEEKNKARKKENEEEKADEPREKLCKPKEQTSQNQETRQKYLKEKLSQKLHNGINTQEETRRMWADDWQLSCSEEEDKKSSSSCATGSSTPSPSGSNNRQKKKKKKKRAKLRH